MSNDSALVSKVAGTVGVADLRFCSHELDEQRAKALHEEIVAGDYSKNEVLIALEAYLTAKECSDEHVASEIKKADSFFVEN